MYVEKQAGRQRERERGRQSHREREREREREKSERGKGERDRQRHRERLLRRTGHAKHTNPLICEAPTLRAQQSKCNPRGSTG